MQQWEMSKRFIETDYIRTGCTLRNKRDNSYGTVVGIIVSKAETTVTISNYTGGHTDLNIKQVWRDYIPGIYA